MIFDNFPVSDLNLLGEAGQGRDVLARSGDCLNLILAGGPLGVMAACLEVLMPTVEDKMKLSMSDRELHVMQGAMADMYSTWCACRAYVYTVARAADWGSCECRDGTGALLHVAEQAKCMAFGVSRFLGSNGHAGNDPAGRLLREATLFARDAVTSESRLLLVAEGLFPREDS